MKYTEIHSRTAELAGAPVKALKSDIKEKIVEDLRAKTPKSKSLFDDALELLPGGSEHMLAHTTPHPPFIDRAEGAYLYDADGNRYIDYMFGGGPVILGHNYPPLRDKVFEDVARKGWFHGLHDELENLAAAQIVKHMPAVDRVRFFQSGTEACMAAARVARAFTGKKKIVKFRGCYHGWSDQFVIDMWVPYTDRLLATGIPEEMSANTVLATLNDAEDLENAIREQKDRGGVAAVILEPMGPESGTIPMEESFPKEIERICRENEALMIFDEVVTGFRLGLGGAQEYYGVDPDITVLGKLISSGFPSTGAVGCQRDIAESMRSGIAVGGAPTAFVAGTMTGSPMTMSAVYHSINEIVKNDACATAGAIADSLVSKLNRLFSDRGSLWFAYNYGSILHVEMTGMSYIDIRQQAGLPEIFERKAAMADYQTFLRSRGIMTLMGKGFVTIAHSESDIDATVDAFDGLLDATGQ